MKTIEQTDRIIARWETKGKDWLELLHHPAYGYSYRGNGCGGGLHACITSDADAIAAMEAPRGSVTGWGQADVLKSDRPSLRRVFSILARA